jgi:glycosyltransferase involved in cell wall biosynthesis
LLGRRSDVRVLYQLADLLLFPSRYEGLSVALAEALANGLPAVVSDIPCNHEVGDGVPSVRFVRPGDVDGLVAAARELLSRDGVREAARAAQATVRTRFSPDTLSLRVAETLARAAEP